MAKRRKLKPFRAVTAVKALARERIGTPPPQQVALNRKKKRTNSDKHKATLKTLLETEE
jgi:hypothetical protein